MTAIEAVARLDKVSIFYGKLCALDHLDLRVEPGEILAVLGPNGAGKTTAIGLMVGILKPDAGRVDLMGKAPDQPGARNRIGVMLQVSGVPDTLKVREHLELFRGYYQNPLPLSEILAVAGLEGLAERFYGKLSGGQKQRLLFGLAICGRPDLVFLDEPTVGLDVTARRALWAQIRALKDRGCAVVLTTHYLEEADALADRIVVIQNGVEIAAGSPAEIKGGILERRIRCRTALSAAQLAELPGVTAVEAVQGLMEIRSTRSDETVRRILALDPTLTDLEIASARLEEAFLHLTRDEQQQEVAS